MPLGYSTVSGRYSGVSILLSRVCHRRSEVSMDTLLSVCDILRSVFWAFQSGSDTLWRGREAGTKNMDSVEFPTLTRREEKCCLTSMRTHFKLPVVLLGLVALPLMDASAASGLEQFKTGDPAKADLVNKNFRYIDSAKADRTDIDILKLAMTAKLNKSVFDSSILEKVGKKEFDSAISAKVDTSGLTKFVQNGGKSLLRIEDAGQRKGAEYSFDRIHLNDFAIGHLEMTAGGLNFYNSLSRIYGNSLSFNRNGMFAFSMITNYSTNEREDILTINSSTLNPGVDQGIQVLGNIKLTGTLIAPTKSFPDFVFSPTYKLQPLSETKAFISQNGHLPNVPSAKDVEKTGMDLVQMNQVLLQKVEELTLHAIAQQERINALEARIPAP